MTPDANEVRRLMMACLFSDGEPQQPYLEAKCITATFRFHPGRVLQYRNDIAAQLAGLPKEFRKQGGGGWSFLLACNTAEGEQWGEHASMEMLFALGIGAGLARWCLPHEDWPAFPGGLPYVVIDLDAPAPVVS